MSGILHWVAGSNPDSGRTKRLWHPVETTWNLNWLRVCFFLVLPGKYKHVYVSFWFILTLKFWSFTLPCFYGAFFLNSFVTFFFSQRKLNKLVSLLTLNVCFPLWTGACRWPGRGRCPAPSTWPGWRCCPRTCRPSCWCVATTRVSSPFTLRQTHRQRAREERGDFHVWEKTRVHPPVPVHT